MRTESEKQELARKIIDREIYYCVSSLVSTLSDLVQNCSRDNTYGDLSWEEDILPLMEYIDYEEAGTQAINDCDDLGTLEEMADGVGFWCDVLDDIGYNAYVEQYDQVNITTFPAMPVDEWVETGHSAELTQIHKYIIEHATDWEEFCRENDVNTDDFRNEVYEHWLISDWLRRKLGERGQVTGELCGLTIWGRCCTGQSIALDHVMQDIACELWPEGEEA